MPLRLLILSTFVWGRLKHPFGQSACLENIYLESSKHGLLVCCNHRMKDAMQEPVCSAR